MELKSISDKTQIQETTNKKNKKKRDFLQLPMDNEQICRSSGKSLRFIGHESVREILFRRNSSRNPNRRESIRSRKTVYLLGTRSFSSPFFRLTIQLSMDVVNELNKIYRPFYTHQGPISFSLENWLLWNFHPAKSITFFSYTKQFLAKPIT